MSKYIYLIVFCISINLCAYLNAQPKNHSHETLHGKLVRDFPAFPLYPNSRLVSSNRKEEGDKRGYDAKYKVNATVNEVVAFYIGALKPLGWQPKLPVTLPGSEIEQSIRFEKGEKILYLNVEHEEGETEISLELPMNRNI